MNGLRAESALVRTRRTDELGAPLLTGTDPGEVLPGFDEDEAIVRGRAQFGVVVVLSVVLPEADVADLPAVSLAEGRVAAARTGDQACLRIGDLVVGRQLGHAAHGHTHDRAGAANEHPDSMDRTRQPGKCIDPDAGKALFETLSSITNPAVDNRRIHRNPCKVNSINRPQRSSRKVVPSHATPVRVRPPAAGRLHQGAGRVPGPRRPRLHAPHLHPPDAVQSRTCPQKQWTGSSAS